MLLAVLLQFIDASVEQLESCYPFPYYCFLFLLLPSWFSYHGYLYHLSIGRSRYLCIWRRKQQLEKCCTTSLSLYAHLLFQRTSSWATGRQNYRNNNCFFLRFDALLIAVSAQCGGGGDVSSVEASPSTLSLPVGALLRMDRGCGKAAGPSINNVRLSAKSSLFFLLVKHFAVIPDLTHG